MAKFINPFVQFVQPFDNSSVDNGELYFGNPNSDPTIPGNQISVRAIQQDGTNVLVSQPITLGPNGVILYNGTPVLLDTDATRYSIAVKRRGVQVYYMAEVTVSGTSLIEDWSSNVDYTRDSSLVRGVNGIGYFARLSSGPSSSIIDPTTDSTRSHWVPYVNYNDTILTGGSYDNLTYGPNFRVRGPGIINAPSFFTAEDAYVTVRYIGTSSIQQEAYQPSANGCLFAVRNFHNGSWTQWRNSQVGTNIVGEIRHFALTTAPHGWFALNGDTISNGLHEYPELAALNNGWVTVSGNDLILADAQNFIRGKGSSARAVGSSQDDAVQNFTGTFNNLVMDNVGTNVTTGVFNTSGAGVRAGTSGPFGASTLEIDASRQIRTDTETRPKNITSLICIYNGGK